MTKVMMLLANIMLLPKIGISVATPEFKIFLRTYSKIANKLSLLCQ
jgi:hypothetical protein